MFLHLSVSHSVHGGVSASGPGGVCYTPRPEQTPPRADTPREDPPEQTDTPWADTPPPWADTNPPVQCMLGYGQQAGGMHPTGMHSCFGILSLCLTCN